MTRKHLPFLILLVAVATACGGTKAEQFTVRTAAAERRTIVVQAEATGIIEPINVVEVKSRSSGQVTQMPVETGTLVRPGQLIVQLDTRDVQNQFDQTKADLEAAAKKLEVSEIQKKRSDDLFASKIITATENEAAQLDFANASSAIVRSRAALDLAQQRLDDARVTAPVTGTIIEKPVSLGQVIQSGTSTAGGGTTIVKMADLTKVRARALVNETDIGQVRPGQEATVVVDAFPDRQFRGTVEKVEPQAVVQQNVTMFPVLVSLENRDGLLMPGMNGEVAIISDRRESVIAIPNEAIRTLREGAQVAALLGLDADSVQAQIRASMGGGPGGGMRTSPGYVDLEALQQQGRPGGQGNFQPIEVTDAQCKAVEAARTAKPAAAKKVDDVQTKMRAEGADRMALMGDLRAAYTELGVEANVARACLRRSGTQGGAQGGTQGGAATPTPGATATRGGASPSTPVQGRANAQGMRGGRGSSRMGLVFVMTADSSYEAKVVRLGVADYDYTEVISGIDEGARVALLSAVALQAQRQENQDRIRQMQGGNSPLGGATGGGAGGGGRPAGR